MAFLANARAEAVFDDDR